MPTLSSSRLCAVLAVLGLFVGQSRATSAQARGEIRGRVVSDSNRRPLERAQVQLPQLGRSTLTDNEGHFSFSGLTRARYLVVTTAPGFRPDSDRFELGEGEVVVLNVALRAAQALRVAQSEPAVASVSRALHGAVRDVAGQPVPMVQLSIGGTPRAVSDDSGRFRVERPPATPFTLDVRRIGFQPARLTVDAVPDTAIVVALTPIAQPLRGQVTETERSRALELHGFYRRMQDRENGLNTGVFIRQEEIERRNPSRFTQLLEGIPSMRLIRSGACGTLWRCYAPRGADGCYMSVFLDGHRLNPLHVPPNENPWLRRDFPDELISPEASPASRSTLASTKRHRSIRGSPAAASYSYGPSSLRRGTHVKRQLA